MVRILPSNFVPLKASFAAFALVPALLMTTVPTLLRGAPQGDDERRGHVSGGGHNTIRSRSATPIAERVDGGRTFTEGPTRLDRRPPRDEVGLNLDEEDS